MCRVCFWRWGGRERANTAPFKLFTSSNMFSPCVTPSANSEEGAPAAPGVPGSISLRPRGQHRASQLPSSCSVSVTLGTSLWMLDTEKSLCRSLWDICRAESVPDFAVISALSFGQPFLEKAHQHSETPLAGYGTAEPMLRLQYVSPDRFCFDLLSECSLTWRTWTVSHFPEPLSGCCCFFLL